MSNSRLAEIGAGPWGMEELSCKGNSRTNSTTGHMPKMEAGTLRPYRKARQTISSERPIPWSFKRSSKARMDGVGGKWVVRRQAFDPIQTKRTGKMPVLRSECTGCFAPSVLLEASPRCLSASWSRGQFVQCRPLEQRLVPVPLAAQPQGRAPCGLRFQVLP